MCWTLYYFTHKVCFIANIPVHYHISHRLCDTSEKTKNQFSSVQIIVCTDVIVGCDVSTDLM